jgi:hypothetical protein
MNGRTRGVRPMLKIALEEMPLPADVLPTLMLFWMLCGSDDFTKWRCNKY